MEEQIVPLKKYYCTCKFWSPKHAISEFVYTFYTALYRDLGLKGNFMYTEFTCKKKPQSLGVKGC